MNIFNKIYLSIIMEGFNAITASKEVMNSIYRIMKSKGYDVRSGEDCRDILKRKPFLAEVHDDWKKAIEEAIGRKKSRISRAVGVKEDKNKYKNVDWDLVNKLGYTNNAKEVGYIDLKGRWLDLSGGGESGVRGEDHRIVGGVSGMQELVSYGYIRVSEGWVELRRLPTKEQMKSLWRFIFYNLQRGNFYIELDKGLGTYSESDEYYYSTSNRLEKGFNKGENPDTVLKFIINYYKN